MSEINPVVSVIIPAYNAADTIGGTINSVLNQNYSYVEIIVVDDGSTDRTEQVVRLFGNKVKYIYQENAGVSVARNTGISAAKGDWIALLDADDEWHPKKLAIQLEIVKNKPELIFISNEPLIQREHEKCNFSDIKYYSSSPFFYWKHTSFLRKNCVHTSSVLLRKSKYDEVGGFDCSLPYAEDRDLWLKLLYKGAGVCIQLPLTKYCQQATGLSRHVVQRFYCDLKIIDRWNNQEKSNLDIERKIPHKVFIKAKYGLLFSMVFKLLKLGKREDAHDFWDILRRLHAQEFPYLPAFSWSFFERLHYLDQSRKRLKRQWKR